MKIGIITFHRAYNYGAVLQAYALFTKIESMGLECEIIDFWPETFKNLYYMQQPFRITHPPIKTWLNHFKVRKVLSERNQNFEKFIEEILKTSNESYISYYDILNAKLDYDSYITGSDQVWNDTCAKFDKTFFLQFPQAKAKNRYAYAASFGFEEIPEGLENEYKKRLEGYRRYSVREKSGARILENLLSIKPDVNCDPTILLSAEEWLKIARETKCKYEKYIFIYYVTKTQNLQKMANDLAKKTGYKVIIVPCNMNIDVLSGKYDKSNMALVNPCISPQEFLMLLKNAEYVLTNSFHGTVFSVLFHKKFLSQINLDNGKKNNRIKELLETIGLENKAILDIERIDDRVDWDSVDEKILEMRKNSEKYLQLIVNDLKSGEACNE